MVWTMPFAASLAAAVWTGCRSHPIVCGRSPSASGVWNSRTPVQPAVSPAAPANVPVPRSSLDNSSPANPLPPPDFPLHRMLRSMRDDQALLADEARYCSFGDTVHYSEPPKIFDRCEGSYLYDSAGTPFLDLQMWYSAVNFGYANPRLNNVLKRQIDTLPQVASQYLHPTKIELAKIID